ncbi:MAG: nucleotide exchange factor GrpE [Phascolarctobacterium sp.]|nr:nucleotide exchange factor GrpE [Candidatus Phascolarctobacterium caballi]
MAEQPNENTQEVKQEELKNEENSRQETAQTAEEVTEEKQDKDVKEEPQPKTDDKDAKIAELEDQLLRARAEFANYKRRMTEDMIKLGTYTTAQVVDKFLTVLDNFERAEQQVLGLTEKTQTDGDANGGNEILKAVVEGMQKIRKQFDETFKKLDVEEIVALNQKFDPNLHEAVMRGANPELADDTIDMVLQKGYKIREQIIRHSKVRVISNQ